MRKLQKLPSHLRTPTIQWETDVGPAPETSSVTNPISQREGGVELQVTAPNEPTPGGREKKPPVELRINHLLAASPARITEEGATTVFNGVTQTVHEHRARHYDAVYLKAPLTTEEELQTTRICRMVREEGGIISIRPGM